MNARRTRLWAILLVLAMLLVACTGTTDDSEGDDTSTETTTADSGGDDSGGDSSSGSDPDDGASGDSAGDDDTFVHAGDDEPLSLDPAQVEAGEYGEAVILQVYDRLLEYTPDGPDLAPGLASEVPTVDNGLISDDGLTYTFPLREGVTFHDGSPMTADDVVFSWDRAMTMDLPEGTAGLLNDNVADMQAVDDLTFEVTLQAPNAAFLNSIVVA